ncbi:Protein mlp1 [Stygiomarasmius scandens]|uniref:Protein mlp1 n=1 Tax=Marasmiellus scandens TaxID=2682957 RepID=A0ABR1IVK2_9AGAR
MGELDATRSTLTAQKNELEAKVALEKEQELQASKVALVNKLRLRRFKKSAREAWETETATLIKDRDDALSKAQTATAEAERANPLAAHREAAIVGQVVNGHSQDARKDAAEQAAVEQAKNEMQAAAAPLDEQVKKLQEELKSLEQRLAQKHQQELKAAAEAAVKKHPARALMRLPLPNEVRVVDVPQEVIKDNRAHWPSGSGHRHVSNWARRPQSLYCKLCCQQDSFSR